MKAFFHALPLLVLPSLVAEARAESGEGVGAGPVLGVTLNGSFSVGWELGGSFRAAPLSRGALGGSYQLSLAEGDPQYFHYLAWEPWLFVGATLGAALTSERDVRVVYGLWEGLAETLDTSPFDLDSGYLDDDSRFQWLLSLSIGWRGIGRTQQFYLTPKVWYFQGWDLFT